MSELSNEKCGTCYGEGEQATEHGLLPCPDCAGLGSLPSGLVRTEWRLREVELAQADASGETGHQVRWLVNEVRRSHHALLQILAASYDTDSDEPTLTRIKFLANEVLGVYPVTSAS